MVLIYKFSASYLTYIYKQLFLLIKEIYRQGLQLQNITPKLFILTKFGMASSEQVLILDRRECCDISNTQSHTDIRLKTLHGKDITKRENN